MLEIICDRCKKDCDRVGFDVMISTIHNPVPVYFTDAGRAQITDDNTHARFVLCQKCYQEMGLPNIHMAVRTGKIEFR